MFFSGPWHMSLIEEQGGAGHRGQVGDRRDAGEGDEDVVRRRQRPRRLQGVRQQGRGLEVRRVPAPTRRRSRSGTTTVSALPSVESAWEGGELSTDEQLALFGEQLKDAKSPPPIPKWEQVAAEAVNAEVEKATTGGSSAEQAAQAMQQKAESIGTG